MSKNYTTVFFLETVIMLYLMRFCLPNNMLLCTLLLNYCSFSPCVTLLIEFYRSERFLFNVNEKSNNLIYWRLALTLAIFKLYREEFFLST
jgi:hypothetical protein